MSVTRHVPNIKNLTPTWKYRSCYIGYAQYWWVFITNRWMNRCSYDEIRQVLFWLFPYSTAEDYHTIFRVVIWFYVCPSFHWHLEAMKYHRPSDQLQKWAKKSHKGLIKASFFISQEYFFSRISEWNIYAGKGNYKWRPKLPKAKSTSFCNLFSSLQWCFNSHVSSLLWRTDHFLYVRRSQTGRFAWNLAICPSNSWLQTMVRSF